MDASELCFTPATEMAKLIKAKQVSPVEVLDAVLTRIEACEPRLNAFATLAAAPAKAAAKAMETALMRGDDVGPLAGIPVTIKDLTFTRDLPTEFGSFARKGFMAPFDAPVVSRLRKAGAIVLGKTTTSEFGWKGVSQSPLTGITHNPWQHGMNAGASSAGAGVAAAAGYGPLHQGSDGAGSIRMPAHFCGVYGLKPTYGRVPAIPVSTGDYTSHTGPLTRTVADAALMLRHIAGPHFGDHTSCEAAPDDYLGKLGAGIRGKRIAFSLDLGHARVDDEVADLVRAAVATFAADLGCAVEEVTPEWGKLGPELVRFFWAAHMSVYKPMVEQYGAQMDPGLLVCIHDGADDPVSEYQRWRERKYAYCNAIGYFFTEWDFLLTPAVSVAAFPADRLMPAHWPDHPWDWLSWAEFSYPFNMSGNPAASIPCGFTASGLPVGLQIVGPRFDDLGVLQASAAFEAARPWADRRPDL
jgi:aspartyl-tRNA(Asn)/glutamyl-tRNA(Gln) amidotransferase subunit A